MLFPSIFPVKLPKPSISARPCCTSILLFSESNIHVLHRCVQSRPAIIQVYSCLSESSCNYPSLAGRNARDWAYYNNATATEALLRDAGVPLTDCGRMPEAELRAWADQRRQRRRQKEAARAANLSAGTCYDTHSLARARTHPASSLSHAHWRIRVRGPRTCPHAAGPRHTRDVRIRVRGPSYGDCCVRESTAAATADPSAGTCLDGGAGICTRWTLPDWQPDSSLTNDWQSRQLTD